jgi:hypothetical protein
MHPSQANKKPDFLLKHTFFNLFHAESDLRLLHMMNVRFSLLNMAQRIFGVTLPNF